MLKHKKQTDISQAADLKMTIHSLKSFQIKFSMNKYLGNCAIYLNTILWLLHEVLSSDYTRRSVKVTRLEADPVASSRPLCDEFIHSLIQQMFTNCSSNASHSSRQWDTPGSQSLEGAATGNYRRTNSSWGTKSA